MTVTIPNLFNARPNKGVRSTGVFVPIQNVTGFNNVTVETDKPFNVILAVRDDKNNLLTDGPRNLVGSESTPYVPSALPVYIPTLYASVYEIQSGLVNGPLEDELTENNRKYPTVRAVKNYVASQLAGSEIVMAFDTTDPNYSSLTDVAMISTNLVTTILNKITGYDYKTAERLPDGPNIDIVNPPDDNKTIILYEFPIDNIDISRNGSVKRVVNASRLEKEFNVGTSNSDNKPVYESMRIYFDDDNRFTKRAFVVNGELYKSYFFGYAGDFIEMVQVIQTNTDRTQEELFFVTNYGGAFGDPYPTPTDTSIA